MRFLIALAVLSLGAVGTANAQHTSCMAHGPILSCNTVGGNNGSSSGNGGGFAAALRAGEEVRRSREERQRERARDQQEAMLMLYRMTQRVNASVPVDATPDQSLALRTDGLDRAYTILTDSGYRFENWRRVRADLLAHPEMVDQALAALDDGTPGPLPKHDEVAPVIVAEAPPQSPEVASRCAALAAAWDGAMQRGDMAAAQQEQNAYLTQCRG